MPFHIRLCWYDRIKLSLSLSFMAHIGLAGRSLLAACWQIAGSVSILPETRGLTHWHWVKHTTPREASEKPQRSQKLSEAQRSWAKLGSSSDSFAQQLAADGLERTGCFETSESTEKRTMCSPSLLERWCQLNRVWVKIIGRQGVDGPYFVGPFSYNCRPVPNCLTCLTGNWRIFSFIFWWSVTKKLGCLGSKHFSCSESSIWNRGLPSASPSSSLPWLGDISGWVNQAYQTDLS